VYLGAHFPSDVLAGACVGSGFGLGAGSLYANRHANRATFVGGDLPGPGLERAAKRR
jgi:membrane-associated phospholipid phosphatase